MTLPRHHSPLRALLWRRLALWRFPQTAARRAAPLLCWPLLTLPGCGADATGTATNTDDPASPGTPNDNADDTAAPSTQNDDPTGPTGDTPSNDDPNTNEQASEEQASEEQANDATCDSLRSLDPTDVYIFGTLQEGLAGRDALAHWSNPNVALVGFENRTSLPHSFIDPSDGRLLFLDRSTYYRFNDDGCRVLGTTLDYPEAPLDNDDWIHFPCSTQRGGVLAAPDGTLAFECSGEWLDEQGTPLLNDRRARPTNFDGQRFLLEDGVYDIASAELRPFTGLEQFFERQASRAHEAGFWMVVTGDRLGEPELFTIDADGFTERVGVYPPPPMPLSVSESTDENVLQPDGTLFSIADRQSIFSVILRRNIDGTSDVVYDERDEPLVKLHISGLITGP